MDESGVRFPMLARSSRSGPAPREPVAPGGVALGCCQRKQEPSLALSPYRHCRVPRT